MEVYVVEGHNGMVSQLFGLNKILVSFRSDCHAFWKVKRLVNIKPKIIVFKKGVPASHSFSSRMVPRAKLIKWMTAHLPKVLVSFGQTTKTSSRSQRNVGSMFAGYTDQQCYVGFNG